MREENSCGRARTWCVECRKRHSFLCNKYLSYKIKNKNFVDGGDKMCYKLFVLIRIVQLIHR